MTPKQAWTLFAKTGNIEAYLLYKERMASEAAEMKTLKGTERLVHKD